jgi:hypothetical protein
MALKPVAEMTPVELLSEFSRKYEYHEAVAEAREWIASAEGQDWAANVGPVVHDARGRGRVLWWKCVGKPMGEVREPRPDEDARWAELCAEINRRFTQRPPAFKGPYR